MNLFMLFLMLSGSFICAMEKEVAEKPTPIQMVLENSKKSETINDRNDKFELNSRSCCRDWKKESYDKYGETLLAHNQRCGMWSFTASYCRDGRACCCLDFWALFCWHRWFCEVKNGRCYIDHVCGDCLPY